MNDGNLYINPKLSIPHWELIFTASRSAGPGGQHANKTNSRVTLHWSLQTTTVLTEHQKNRVKRKLAHRLTSDGMLQINVEDFRSQHRNKEIAQERLREILLNALKVAKKRKPTKPSKAAKQRRMNEKKSRGSVKKLRQKPTQE